MKYRNLFILALASLLCFNCTHAQPVVLNGDFQKINAATKFPVGWDNFMGDKVNYDFKLDSSGTPNGKYALTIASKNSDGNYGAMDCVINNTYKGHEIKLTGYLKTENVTGYAGFWLRIDGTSSFNNMQDQNIKGTTDWKEYSITLPYDYRNAENINAGALMAGKGKIWFNDVRVYIDNKPVEELKPLTANLFKAQKDTAFLQGSGMADFVPTGQQVKDLALLCQVWGFVKYHLPTVAAGNINMDAELFRVMPAVTRAQNYAEASNAIEQWVDKLGAPAACGICKPFKDKDVAQKPDYGEIFDRNIVSQSLADKLTFILNNHDDGKSYYVSMHPLGNPDFTHELPYVSMSYPDSGYRLLCLFRYWNMVQYFFPDKYLIGENWANVLTRMVPQFLAAKDAEEYDVATMAVIASVHDTHANIWSSPQGLTDFRGKYAPPIVAKFIENHLVVTGYYNDTLGVKDNFKVGDVIMTINGARVEDLVKKFLPLTAASNYETQLRDMPREYLLRSGNPDFVFDVLRDGKTTPVKQSGIAQTKLNYLAAADPHRGEPGYHLIGNKIGYVYPGRYHNKDLPAIKEMFKDTRGIIIDMRCYPSEFMPFTFVPYIKSNNSDFVKFTDGSVYYPGTFRLTKPLSVSPDGGYKGKVIVIVNEESQSQAEYTTMAFQSADNVTVIGSTTAGADGDVSRITLPGGIVTMFSGLGVLYPDGTVTQRKGVKIDIIVKPTIEGIKARRDEPLEKAKAIILGGS